MLVAMVDVRVVGMGMPHRRVEVRMAMRFPRRIVGAVRVLVVFVVDVAMVVEHLFVYMNMFVAFRQVEPYAQTHERGRRQKNKGEFLSKNE